MWVAVHLAPIVNHPLYGAPRYSHEIHFIAFRHFGLGLCVPLPFDIGAPKKKRGKWAIYQPSHTGMHPNSFSATNGNGTEETIQMGLSRLCLTRRSLGRYQRALAPLIVDFDHFRDIIKSFSCRARGRRLEGVPLRKFFTNWLIDDYDSVIRHVEMSVTRRLPSWMQHNKHETHSVGLGATLLTLSPELLENIATCGPRGFLLRVGSSLAGTCRRTRDISDLTRETWTQCPSCKHELDEECIQWCELCSEPLCLLCRGEIICAESLHDSAETPAVCRGCRGGAGGLPPDWSRCQICQNLLCSVCHVVGGGDFQVCDECS